jgi:hypothetical protein
MHPGIQREPVLVGQYKYHFTFKNMDEAYRIIEHMGPKDEPSVITTGDRPSMYLVYNPNSLVQPGPDDKMIVDDPNYNPTKLTFHSWNYWDYIKCGMGYWGTEYFLFGNGKVFPVVPSYID